MSMQPSTPAPTTPPADTGPTQPGAPGQGQPQGQPRTTPQQQQQRGARAQGFRGNFPNIPDEQWGTLEPHLREVQRYVTQVEQKAAPFKDYTPQQVQGLASFAQAFDSDPVGMWVRIAQDLQSKGLIHEDLDIEALQAVIQGNDPDVAGTPDAGVGEEEIPAWAQELNGRLDRMEQAGQEQERARMERTQDLALNASLDKMKEQLKAAGIDTSDQKRMVSLLIAHNGNISSAVEAEVSYKNSLLKGIVPNDEEDVDLNGAVPRSRPRPKSTGDAFADARGGAEQFLRQAAKQSQS